MKAYKPYVNLTQEEEQFKLGVVFAATKDQTIASIRQEQVMKDDKPCWGVIISISSATQIVNGPDIPVFSTDIDIALDKSLDYSKIVCFTEIITPDGRFGPQQGESTSIDFGDGH